MFTMDVPGTTGRSLRGKGRGPRPCKLMGTAGALLVAGPTFYVLIHMYLIAGCSDKEGPRLLAPGDRREGGWILE